ncbi:MAG: sigma-70 family RNA polymerase sigma factor [Fimbriiglobus sp.]|nr:sigma-70 family RNA polymerase sigma factor [Fimbriiglobus sp.]
MRQLIPSAAAQSRGVIAAVVIGTALTATGTASADDTRPVPTTDVNGEQIRDVARYCQVCWRNARLPADAWDDCTQQVLARLLQTIRPAHWTLMLQVDGEEKREFLRAIDAVKKRTQRARRPGELGADVADVRQKPTAVREQWEAVNVAAEQVFKAIRKLRTHLGVDA